MLTAAQKVSVRRHLRLPFAGTAQAGRLFGWRFQSHVEDVEYRMNNMQPSEEALLTGVSVGSYRIDGVPTVDDVLTATVTGVGSAQYTVALTDITQPVNQSPTFSVALGLASAFSASLAPTGYQAVAVQPADLFVAPMFTSYFAELIIVGPGSAAFTLSASRSGTTNFVVDSQGVTCPAVATINNQTLYGYLAILDSLAMQIAQTSLSLTYSVADVVTFRPDEIRARRALYHEYRMQFARLMGGEEYVRIINRSSGSMGATA